MEFEGQTIADAAALLSQGTQTWLNVLNLTVLAGILFLGMREAIVLFLAYVLSMPFNIWMFTQVGLFHPLTGLGHVLFWIPAVVWFGIRVKRLGWDHYKGWYRRAALGWSFLLASMFIISNFWDVLNLGRFLLMSDPGPRI